MQMTFGRMEPGSSAWSAAHDRHLSPPDYDGCEDCDCEDPETPMTVCDCHDGHSNADTVCMYCWSHGRRKPSDPEVPEDTPCACECHNIPHDPREDGDEPDDIPDYWDDRDIYDGGF